MSMPDEELNRQSSGSSDEGRHWNHDDLCGEVEAYIKSRPFRAMGIALLAGILVGKIFL
jgi:ElaB/YqjD/DUF883 family membrane-anchored ribosome-binding protein